MKTRFPPPLKHTLFAAAALGLLGCIGEPSQTSAQATSNPAAAEAKAASATAPVHGEQAKTGTPRSASAKSETPKAEAAQPGTGQATGEAEPDELKKLSGPKRDLDAPVAEVVQLVEAGVGDEAVIAFVQNSKNVYELNADDILYLNDLGISSEVIAAMLRKSGRDKEQLPRKETTTPEEQVAKASEPAKETQAAASIQPAPAISGVAPQPTAPPAPPAGTQPAPPPQPPPTVTYNYNYFYDYLSPYGTWYVHPIYGHCWEPTVAVTVRGWRPYCHNGFWLYTDYGWYWSSHYSWGWIPFHYGRWFCHRGRWLWVPDYVWGPSWVCWRRTDDFCGWAPLPPGCSWSAGVGLTFTSGSVGVSFGFGLVSDHFTFVAWNRFCDRQPWRHRVSRERAEVVYQRSTVINNYIVGNNNTVINEGIGRDQIASAARSEVRKVSLRDVDPQPGVNFKGEQLDPTGTTLAVYRPKFPDLRSTKVRPIEAADTTGPAKANGAPPRAIASASAPTPESSPIVFPAKPRRKAEALGGTPSAPVARPVPTSTIARPVERPQAPSAEPRAVQTENRTDPGRQEVKPALKVAKGGQEKLARNEFVPKPGVGDVNLSQPEPTTKPAEPIVPQERSGKLNTPKINTAPKVGVAPQPSTLRPTGSGPSVPDSPPLASAPSAPRQEQPKYSPRPTPQIDRPGLPSPSVNQASRPGPSYATPSAPSPAYQTPSRPAPSYAPPPSTTRPPPTYSPPVSRPAPSYSAPPVSPSAPSYSPPPVARPAPSYSAPPSRPAPSYSPPPAPSGERGSNSRRTQPN